MSARRRRKHEPEEEHENEERWMASYMDMVTVLMCMFIVLFAMSTVDQKKFAELKDSLATGFGQVKSQKIDTATGVIVPPSQVDDKGKNTDLALAQQEAQNLKDLKDRILAALTKDGLQDAVQLRIDARGLTIGLVGNETFFASNRAELSVQATQVLNDIGPVLTPTPYQVSVEGHADLRQPGAPYPTNWELSAGRATSVLGELKASEPIAEAAAVSTCNRSELYLLVSDPVAAESVALGVLSSQAAYAYLYDPTALKEPLGLPLRLGR